MRGLRHYLKMAIAHSTNRPDFDEEAVLSSIEEAFTEDCLRSMPVRQKQEELIKSPAVMSFPVTANGGQQWDLSQDAWSHMVTAYPAINIRNECNKILAWVTSNPQYRKTPGGMLRFINAWLAKANDRGGSPDVVSRPPRRGEWLPKKDRI